MIPFLSSLTGASASKTPNRSDGGSPKGSGTVAPVTPSERAAAIQSYQRNKETVEQSARRLKRCEDEFVEGENKLYAMASSIIEADLRQKGINEKKVANDEKKLAIDEKNAETDAQLALAEVERSKTLTGVLVDMNERQKLKALRYQEAQQDHKDKVAQLETDKKRSGMSAYELDGFGESPTSKNSLRRLSFSNKKDGKAMKEESLHSSEEGIVQNFSVETHGSGEEAVEAPKKIIVESSLDDTISSVETHGSGEESLVEALKESIVEDSMVDIHGPDEEILVLDSKVENVKVSSVENHDSKDKKLVASEEDNQRKGKHSSTVGDHDSSKGNRLAEMEALLSAKDAGKVKAYAKQYHESLTKEEATKLLVKAYLLAMISEEKGDEDTFTVPELRKLLTKCNVRNDGNKAVLVKKALNHVDANIQCI